MKKIENAFLFKMSMSVIIGSFMITGANAQTVTAEQVVPPATNSSMIIGFQNTPITGNIGTGSYIVGHKNVGTGTYLTIVGYDNSVTTTQSAIVFGKGNAVTNGYTSSAIGYYNNVSAPTATAFGRENLVSGNGSGMAFGYANQSTAYESAAFGLKNIATNYQACAFGARNITSGQYSNAFGTKNKTIGDYSGAYGYHNTANAVNSYIFGQMITNNTSNSVMVGVNDNAKITILNNGNVGINNATPISKLSVSIPVSTSTVGGDPNAYGAYFSDNASVTLALRSLGNGIFHLATDGAGRKIVLGGGAFEQTVFINSGGSVGIGTSNTADANYKLFVETGIRTRKVKVDQASWPDYVFDSSYTPQPLVQVERFIKENKHLPGVPSEAEVQKDGINLGDNQAILLKKIEELTLYVIEIKKENDAQQKKIGELSETVKRLAEK